MNSSVSAESRVLADTLAQSENADVKNVQKLDGTQKNFLRIWLLLGLVLPLLSMIPFLYVQGKRLFDQQSFLFFPLSTVFGIWLLYRTCDYRPAGRRRDVFAVLMACFGMGLIVLGIFFVSPWIVQAASVVVIFAWSLGAFGGSNWTRVVAICSLFAVSVPLPGGRDVQINLWLQSISSWACNGFLDAIGVPNIIDGNILQIEDRKILVSEVCSGVDSVFALMAIGLAVVVFRRCSLLLCLVTLSSVPFCFVLGNMVRLLAIAIGFEYFDIDISTGFGHIVTSVVVFVGSVACMLLLHVSLEAILEPVSKKMDSNNLTLLYQRATTWPQDDEALWPNDTHSIEDKNEVPRPRAIIWSLGLSCIASLVFGAISAYAVFSVGDSVAVRGIGKEQAAALPSQDAFPDQFGRLRKISFSPTTQSATNGLGKYSHLWRFDDKGSSVLVSLDFPFQGWRALWTVYKSFGWEIIETKPVEIPAELGASYTVEEFKMQNQNGLFGSVWYAFFDENGVPTTRADESVGSSRINIFNKLQKTPGAELVTCFQVQMFFESGRDLSELEFESNRQLFFEVFERIRQQSVTALKKAK